MEHDRESSQVMMDINRYSKGISSVILMSAKLRLTVLIFLARMAKKGLVATGYADGFKEFVTQTQGAYTVYNVPISEQQTKAYQKMNDLQLQLEQSKNLQTKAQLRKKIKVCEKEIPELQQLEKLGVQFYALPKVNGTQNTFQIAIANENQQLFKNWFLNHLTSSLAGGEKSIEELKAFTEGNYSIFNLPFEGEKLAEAIPDFEKLGLNFNVLPDLKIGDGNIQLAIPNTDRNKLEVWFKMWKDKQLQEGRQVGAFYTMDEDSYLANAELDQEDYVAFSDQKYQDANLEFEKQSKPVPWEVPLGKENSEEYVKFLQNDNFEKITINRESLVENIQISSIASELQKEGFFISRIPGTYGVNQQTLILPQNQAFLADDGKTFIAFLPKNQPTTVLDSKGQAVQRPFAEVYKPYDSVQRSFKNVQEIKGEVQIAPKTQKPGVKKNQFTNISQREYNMAKLEEKLLNAQIPKI